MAAQDARALSGADLLAFVVQRGQTLPRDQVHARGMLPPQADDAAGDGVGLVPGMSTAYGSSRAVMGALRDGFMVGVHVMKLTLNNYHPTPEPSTDALPGENALQHSRRVADRAVRLAGVPPDVLEATAPHPFGQRAACATCVRGSTPPLNMSGKRSTKFNSVLKSGVKFADPFVKGRRGARETLTGFERVREALQDTDAARQCLASLRAAAPEGHAHPEDFALGAAVAVATIVQRCLEALDRRRAAMQAEYDAVNEREPIPAPWTRVAWNESGAFTQQVGYQLHMDVKGYVADVQYAMARRLQTQHAATAAQGGAVTPAQDVSMANATAESVRAALPGTQPEAVLRFAFANSMLRDYDDTPYPYMRIAEGERTVTHQCPVCMLLTGPFAHNTAVRGNAAGAAYGTCLPPLERQRPLGVVAVARVLDAVETLGMQCGMPHADMNASAGAVARWMREVYKAGQSGAER
uniref:Uncharacterized protein n=1 Tax=viral metagenome TaxID=1070528 RepID=A0A6C0AUH8_9ZZZZ